MTSAAVEGSLGAWLRRLPTYLYLVDLLPGKRVLEVGCGVGYGAQFLANHGAGRVVGVDRSPGGIAEARSRYRQTNLEFRCEELGSIELDDASFDCIFVPDGIDVLRRTSILRELRRLLSPSGHLVLCGPSADRRGGAAGGASFFEFRERLERFFAPVRMVAQAPFVGFSLVEFASGPAGAGDDEALETHLDTSLLELAGGEGEASDYVAVCGGSALARARGYAVVQVPERGGIEAAAAAIGGRAAGVERETIVAADEPASAAPSEGARDALLVRELRLRLETATAERQQAQAQVDELRAEVDELRGRAEGLRTEANQLRDRAEDLRAAEGPLRTEAGELRAEAGELRQRLAEMAREVEAPASAGPSPSELIAAAMTAHREAVRSLEIAVEEGEAYAEELRADLELAAGRVEGERTARRRGEARAERLEGELREWRTRASMAEGKLLRMARAGNGAEPAGSRERVASAAAPSVGGTELEAALAAARAEARAAAVELAALRAEALRSPPAAPSSTQVGARVAELERELAAARTEARAAATQIESLQADVRAHGERIGGNGDAAHHAASAVAVATAKAASVGRDVARRLARFELEVESGRSLIQEVETGLALLERQIADDAAERAPSAWAAHRDQQLRELASELGIKDAEIVILHIGVSALRARVRELVGEVRRATGQARDRSMPEMIQLLDHLGEWVATFDEEREPASAP